MMRAKKNMKNFSRKYVPPDMKNKMTDNEAERHLSNAKKRPPEIETAVIHDLHKEYEIETAVIHDLHKEYEDKLKLLNLFCAKANELPHKDYTTMSDKERLIEKQKINQMKLHFRLLEEDVDNLRNKLYQKLKKRIYTLELQFDIWSKDNNEKSTVEIEEWKMEQVEDLCIFPPEKHAIIFSEIGFQTCEEFEVEKLCTFPPVRHVILYSVTEFQTCTEFEVEKVYYEPTKVLKEEEHLVRIDKILDPPMICKNPKVEALQIEDRIKTCFTNMKIHFCNRNSKVTFGPQYIEVLAEQSKHVLTKEPQIDIAENLQFQMAVSNDIEVKVEKVETMQFQMPLIQYAKMIEEPQLDLAENLQIQMAFSNDIEVIKFEKEVETMNFQTPYTYSIALETEKELFIEEPKYSSFSSEKIYCAKSRRSTENVWLKLPNHRKCIKKKYFVKRHSAAAQMKTAKVHMDIRRMKILMALIMPGAVFYYGRNVPRVFDRGRNGRSTGQLQLTETGQGSPGRRLMIAKFGWKIG